MHRENAATKNQLIELFQTPKRCVKKWRGNSRAKDQKTTLSEACLMMLATSSLFHDLSSLLVLGYIACQYNIKSLREM
jgi:hypothetical protein